MTCRGAKAVYGMRESPEVILKKADEVSDVKISMKYHILMKT
jgi:hypothetical protein